MPSYSSREVYQDWRYAIDKDFVTLEDKSFSFADNGRLQWGGEGKKLSFDGEHHRACASDDGKYLAVAVDKVIHVIDTDTWKTVILLRGHTSSVSGLAFKIDDSNTLVSSENEDHDRNKEATIIVWQVDKAKEMPASIALDGASKAAAATAHKLDQFGVNIKEDALQELQTALNTAVSSIVARDLVKDNVRIHGRLRTSFQSQVFSPSGKWMVYLPGREPMSNDSAHWDIEICSTNNLKTWLTLKGHTDAIMWMGWSPDELRFASMAWDGSIRVWDATTGQQMHCFKTDEQNWTGEFSPDSRRLVATDGDGIVRVYALDDDEPLYWQCKPEGPEPWRRAVAWHPDGKLIAVGGEDHGELLMLDIDKKQVTQRRRLSTAESRVDKKNAKQMMGDFVGVDQVQFLDGGNKLATWIHGDSSAEVFDISTQTKWRFARGGIEDGPDADKWRDKKGKVTSKGGHGMVAWEDQIRGKIMVASVDFDGVRIWSAPKEN
ncbi:hypothetical protein FZEAL_6713 [Fusarium zealandicum]|uniref:WD40 repeat-like protein n=1 Tax=Fusarium zealandicum TaxID=1053134 RepID=A0A8H4UH89_9HYPO|nr:hypothetical protein FZEAL_6713 [Fusarium zealandicum]